MYVHTYDGREIGLGEPQPPKTPPPPPPLQKTFISNIIAYKDAKEKCQSTNCAIYVPSVLRDQAKVDLVVFFHGLDTCSPTYDADPQKVVKNFRLDYQVENATRKAALVVPLVLWNSPDRNQGFIRSAWSAAYLNAFVEEVLDEIGKSSKVRPSLDHLIIVGHSAGYDIMVPLAEQFDCNVAETKKGALQKLSKVIAMDIPHADRHCKALEDWARSRPALKVFLVFSKAGTPPDVWTAWRKKNAKVPLPSNIQQWNMLNDKHCVLPWKYLYPLL